MSCPKTLISLDIMSVAIAFAIISTVINNGRLVTTCFVSFRDLFFFSLKYHLQNKRAMNVK